MEGLSQAFRLERGIHTRSPPNLTEDRVSLLVSVVIRFAKRPELSARVPQIGAKLFVRIYRFRDFSTMATHLTLEPGPPPPRS